jgi:carbamoyl-phosphate synthase large subunit
MNVQFAIQGDKVYVLEVNPRASRTVPYVSKATGAPLAKIAALCMVGRSLAEQGFTREIIPPYYSVKEAVFPFIKFPGVDTILGPEMKSTGEVMGVGETFAEAFVKSQLAAGVRLPKGGKAFLSVRNADKAKAVEWRAHARRPGLRAGRDRGHRRGDRAGGLKVQPVNKVMEGRPHIVDMLKNREVTLIVNTVEEDQRSIRDSWSIRNAAPAEPHHLLHDHRGRARGLPRHARAEGAAPVRYPDAPQIASKGLHENSDSRSSAPTAARRSSNA